MCVAKGQYDFTVEDLYQSNTPNKITVGLIASEAYSGSYTRNPFNFHHYNVNYVAFNSPPPTTTTSDAYIPGLVRNITQKVILSASNLHVIVIFILCESVICLAYSVTHGNNAVVILSFNHQKTVYCRSLHKVKQLQLPVIKYQNYEDIFKFNFNHEEIP